MPSIRQYLRKWLKVKEFTISDRRYQLSRQFDLLYRSTVQYGPFRGLKFSSQSWWNISDRAAMIFGLYEQEILDQLPELSRKYNRFLDVGAADGYYAVGVLHAGLFKHAICFEVSEQGRSVILDTARLNHVADKIEVHGEATPSFVDRFSEEELNDSVFLVDIEGGEFSLLTEEFFRRCPNSVVIVELHGWADESGDGMQQLFNAARKTHTAKRFCTGKRDLSVFPELLKVSDDDRWILCSEGRRWLMQAVRFDPLAQSDPEPFPS